MNSAIWMCHNVDGGVFFYCSNHVLVLFQYHQSDQRTGICCLVIQAFYNGLLILLLVRLVSEIIWNSFTLCIQLRFIIFVPDMTIDCG